MPFGFEVNRLQFRYQGTFDYDKLYQDLRTWFRKRGFVFDELTTKWKPPEIELLWRGYRKDTGYKKTTIWVDFKLFHYKEVKEKATGKKLVSARFWVRMWGQLEYDYEGRFDKSPLLKKMRDFLHRFVLYYKTFIIDGDKVFYELNDLQAEMRRSIETTLDRGGAFD